MYQTKAVLQWKFLKTVKSNAAHAARSGLPFLRAQSSTEL